MAGIYASLDVYVNTPMPLKAYQNKKSPQQSSSESKQSNIAKTTSTLLAITTATASYANAKVGQYTGNKIRQSNIQQGINLAAMGIGTAINPVVGLTTLAGYLVKNSIDYGIRVINTQQEAEFKRSYRGKMTTSGSRWRSNT